MRFTCSSKDIASAVGAASKVVNAHTTVPILSNVLLQADGEKIAVRATDLELTLEHAFPAQVSEGGSVTVPAKLFASYLGNLAAGTLELTGTPTRASVKFERSELRFPRIAGRRVSAAAGRHARLALHDRGQTLPGRDRRDDLCGSSEEARGAVLMGTLLEWRATR